MSDDSGLKDINEDASFTRGKKRKMFVDLHRVRTLLANIILCALALFQVGCLVGPDFKTPGAPIATKWLGADGMSQHGQRNELHQWWVFYNDPVLTKLIELAYAQNLSLLSAGTRVLQARAFLGIASNELYPQSQYGSGFIKNDRLSQAIPLGAGGTANLGNYWLDALATQATWELDIWGKIRRGIEYADASYLESIATYDDVLVSLLGDVATTYIDIRVLERRIQIAEANIIRQRDVVRIARERNQGGVATQLDVHQAQNILSNTEASVPRLQIELNKGLNALRVLLGMAPEPLGFLLARSTARIPLQKSKLMIGIPADLLRRRPDIRAAELRAEAQSARIGVAFAEILPAISIVGSFGGIASDTNGHYLGQVVHPIGQALSVGPSFKWNILTYGRIISDVRLQDAKLQQNLIDYQNAVLKAQQEVENGIYTTRLSQSEAAYLKTSVEEAKKAITIGLLEYNEGTRDFTTVLNTEQYLYNSENSYAVALGNISKGSVAIYRALGGGWQIRDGKGFVNAATAREMRARTNWGDVLPPNDQPMPDDPGLPGPENIGPLLRLPEW